MLDYPVLNGMKGYDAQSSSRIKKLKGFVKTPVKVLKFAVYRYPERLKGLSAGVFVSFELCSIFQLHEHFGPRTGFTGFPTGWTFCICSTSVLAEAGFIWYW